MTRMLYSFFAIMSLLALSGSAFGQSARSVLIPESTANNYGLHRAWFAQVTASQGGAKINHWSLDEKNLYVLTTQSLLHAIDLNSGVIKWVRPVGKVSAPALKPTAADGKVAVTAGKKLSLLDAETGQLEWEVELGRIATGPAAIGHGYVYIPTADGRLFLYDILDPRNEKHYATGQLRYAPVVLKQGVCWATQNSSIMTFLNVAQDRTSFRFETPQPASAALAYFSPYVFIATKSDMIYAIKENQGARQGQVGWTFDSPDAITSPPVPAENQLFVTVKGRGLFNIQIALPPAKDKSDTVDNRVTGGTVNWSSPNIANFISASKKSVYAETTKGDLRIIDRKTGRVIGEIEATASDLKLVNRISDRILVATSTGLIQCLHETDLVQPLLHAKSLDKDEKKK